MHRISGRISMPFLYPVSGLIKDLKCRISDWIPDTCTENSRNLLVHTVFSCISTVHNNFFFRCEPTWMKCYCCFLFCLAAFSSVNLCTPCHPEIHTDCIIKLWINELCNEVFFFFKTTVHIYIVLCAKCACIAFSSVPD
jgi:hypothetical protein